ncbi:nucleotidyltransferase domain-containing protein [Paenibacillus oryzisoli]|uniref:nucleotidyltransferase family protein n=1 Tax=Paenibacillus oryzisoli TaxID=1850517 RepID=UPI003D2ADBAE
MLRFAQDQIPSLTETEVSAIDELKSIICTKFSIREFILFGSKARGDYTKDSDVDILVLVDEESSMANRNIVWSDQYDINLKHDTDLSCTLRNYEKFYKGEGEFPTFVRSVMEEGISIEL